MLLSNTYKGYTHELTKIAHHCWGTMRMWRSENESGALHCNLSPLHFSYEELIQFYCEKIYLPQIDFSEKTMEQLSSSNVEIFADIFTA